MSHLSSVSMEQAISRSPASNAPSRFPLLHICLLTYVIFIFSRVDIPDPDLWWHLRNAKYLLTTGHLPVADTFSFTAAGTPVLPFEWLSEVAYYGAYKIAGLYGIFALVFLLCTAIFLGVFYLCNRVSHNSTISLLATIGGAILAKVSIGGRTLLFGWLYLVILLVLLEQVRRERYKWLWAIPPLFCLWINSHGSWPMGIVVFGIFIGSGLLDGSWGHANATRWSQNQMRVLFIAATSSVAALFVNPFGFRLVSFPFKVMFGGGSSTGPATIQEFASVDFHTPLGKLAMLLILGTLLVSVFSRARWRLDEIGFIILTFYFALTNVRFLFLAGILAPPIFAKRLSLMGHQENSNQARIADTAQIPSGQKANRWLVNATVLALFVFLFVKSAPQKLETLVNYPDGALTYMKANGIQGRLFHDWDWGGYIMWNAPELKVFIDARGEPYSANGVFADYWSATTGSGPQPVLDKYKIDYVLMPPGSRLSKSLKANPAWTQLHADNSSILFRRAVSTR